LATLSTPAIIPEQKVGDCWDKEDKVSYHQIIIIMYYYCRGRSVNT